MTSSTAAAICGNAAPTAGATRASSAFMTVSSSGTDIASRSVVAGFRASVVRVPMSIAAPLRAAALHRFVRAAQQRARRVVGALGDADEEAVDDGELGDPARRRGRAQGQLASRGGEHHPRRGGQR